MARKLVLALWICLAAGLFTTAGPAAWSLVDHWSGAPPVQASASQREAPLATAVPPSWSLSVYEFRDPYEGPIQQPPLPATRVVGAEIEVANTSDKSLTVYLNNLRLHTDLDITYPGGVIVGVPDTGEELVPKLIEGVVEPGQRIRGWVWWRIPEGEQLREIIFFPSPPPPSVVPLPLPPEPASP